MIFYGQLVLVCNLHAPHARHSKNDIVDVDEQVRDFDDVPAPLAKLQVWCANVESVIKKSPEISESFDVN